MIVIFLAVALDFKDMWTCLILIKRGLKYEARHYHSEISAISREIPDVPRRITASSSSPYATIDSRLGLKTVCVQALTTTIKNNLD